MRSGLRPERALLDRGSSRRLLIVRWDACIP